MGRPPCCDRLNVKRGLWTAEEDAKLLAYVSNHGIENWTSIPKKAGLNRCGKSCRLRWVNYLRPGVEHHRFTPQEEGLIIDLHKAIGSRWSLIAKQLPGRTDNDVKNYWNTKLRKKLIMMGIDPITHKSFQQVLSDYGSTSGLTEPAKQKRCANSDLGNKMTNVAELSAQTGLPNAHSWQNHALFQAMNQEMVQLQPHFFDEASLSSSVSSSSASSSYLMQFSSPQSYFCQPPQTQKTPSSTFGGSDFLLDEILFDQQEEHDSFQGVLTPGDGSRCNMSAFADENSMAVGYEVTNSEVETNDSLRTSESLWNSFPDAILNGL